jgi:hypothetical protein
VIPIPDKEPVLPNEIPKESNTIYIIAILLLLLISGGLIGYIMCKRKKNPT